MKNTERSISFKAFLAGAETGDVEKIKKGLASNPEWAKRERIEAHGSGGTALHVAAWHGHADCVRALLPLSDANQRDRADKNTALIVAAWNGQEKSVRELLPVSDALAFNDLGLTALMCAGIKGSAPCAIALLPHSDPNAQNNKGSNALMRAIESRDSACVRALAKHTDLRAKNIHGETVLSLAVPAAMEEALGEFLRSGEFPPECEEKEVALRAALDWKRWGCADLIAASMSLERAKKLRAQIPPVSPLPQCDALIEQEALSEATSWSRTAQSGSARSAATSGARRV